MGRHLIAISLLLVIGFLLAACGGDSEPTATPSPALPVETPEIPVPTPPADENTPVIPDDDDVYPQPVQVAVEAAAEEAGVPVDEVRVVSYQERAWASTALGCPQPGFSYAQVVTPGYFALIRAGETVYEYHTNMTTNAVLCASNPAE